MEMTLVLLKPDCRQRRIIGEIIKRLEEAELQICACKLVRFTPELLQNHYSHIVHMPFFPKLAQYMQSAPVLALALRGVKAVERVRALVGPTDARKAPKGTIRGDFGQDSTVNVVHASDSKMNAEIELKRFFREDELFLD